MIAIRALLALATALVGAAASAKEFTSSDIYAADYPTVMAVAHLDSLIRERTQGRHSIRRLGAGDLDSENLTVREVRSGKLDLARVNLAVFHSAVPSTVVPSLPFLFKSTAHMKRVLDGPIGDAILADLESEGVIGLCFYDTGFRSYGATRPIRAVGDMKGLKVRAQAADTWAIMLRTMGAEPVVMPISRISASLKAGVIDAVEGTLSTDAAVGIFDVAKFFSLTEHSMAPGVLVFSKHVWDELSREDQAIIRAAAKESVPYMRGVWDGYQISARVLIEKSGGQIIDEVDRASFAAVLLPLYPRLVPNARLQDLVRRIKSMD